MSKAIELNGVKLNAKELSKIRKDHEKENSIYVNGYYVTQNQRERNKTREIIPNLDSVNKARQNRAKVDRIRENSIPLIERQWKAVKAHQKQAEEYKAKAKRLYANWSQKDRNNYIISCQKQDIEDKILLDSIRYGVNKLFKTKRIKGSEFPDYLNVRDRNTVKGDDGKLYTVKTYNNYIDDTSRDDIEQIAAERILITRSQSVQSNAVNNARKGANAVFSRMQYNTYGRSHRKQTIWDSKDPKPQNPIYISKDLEITKKTSIDAIISAISERRQGKDDDTCTLQMIIDYNQLIKLDSGGYKPIDQNLIESARKGWILSEMNGEQAKLIETLDSLIEPCKPYEGLTIHNVRSKMQYDRTINRKAVWKRMDRAKAKYRELYTAYNIIDAPKTRKPISYAIMVDPTGYHKSEQTKPNSTNRNTVKPLRFYTEQAEMKRLEKVAIKRNEYNKHYILMNISVNIMPNVIESVKFELSETKPHDVKKNLPITKKHINFWKMAEKARNTDFNYKK